MGGINLNSAREGGKPKRVFDRRIRDTHLRKEARLKPGDGLLVEVFR